MEFEAPMPKISRAMENTQIGVVLGKSVFTFLPDNPSYWNLILSFSSLTHYLPTYLPTYLSIYLSILSTYPSISLLFFLYLCLCLFILLLSFCGFMTILEMSGVILDYVLKHQSWHCSGNHVWCQILILELLHARKVTYWLFYFFFPECKFCKL